jgi:hypothetical protein
VAVHGQFDISVPSLPVLEVDENEKVHLEVVAHQAVILVPKWRSLLSPAIELEKVAELVDPHFDELGLILETD